MVWGRTHGKPRLLSGCEEEGEEAAGDDIQAVQPQCEDDEVAEGMGCSADPVVLAALTSLGEELLEDAARSLPWSAATHFGFRPFKLMGYARAIATWQNFCSRSQVTYTRIHPGSLAFPDGGLSMKVLADRFCYSAQRVLLFGLRLAMGGGC